MAKGNGFHKRVLRAQRGQGDYFLGTEPLPKLNLSQDGVYKVHGNFRGLDQGGISASYFFGEALCLEKIGERVELVGMYGGEMWRYQGRTSDFIISSNGDGIGRIDLGYGIARTIEPTDPKARITRKKLGKIYQPKEELVSV